MAGVAEVEVACGQVDETEEHGDEHATFVVFAGESIVDACGNLCRHHTLGGEGT